MKKILIICFFILFLSSCMKESPRIFFESNGALSYQSVYLDELNELPKPIKSGYTFKGWYLESEFQNEVKNHLEIKSEVTLFARWELNHYSLKFETNGGSYIEDLNFTVEDNIVFLPISYKQGYIFDGWYLDQDLKLKLDYKDFPSEDIILYAKWISEKYSINFYVDDKIISTYSFNYNDEINIDIDTIIPTKEGFQFKGWNDKLPEKMPLYDLNIYANFEINVYRIEMYDSNGDFLGFEMIPHGEDFYTKLVPNQPSQNFSGWLGNTKNITQDGSLVATYTDSINISFDSNGGEQVSDLIIKIGTNLEELVEIYKENYKFLGWFLDAALTIKYTGQNLYYDTVLYASFEYIIIEEIVIMHDSLEEVDPFHVNYQGKDKIEKQEKQREVEKSLNVKIIYKEYPSYAVWGTERVNQIIRSSVSGSPLADIYFTNTNWTNQLVKGNAIVSVDKYMDKWGQNITNQVQEIGSYNGQLYGFMTGKPTVDVGLFYNIELLEELGIPNPTEMYLNGDWTWSKFEMWATAAKASLKSKGDDYSPLGGVVGIWAQNMVLLNGGSLLNSQTGKVTFDQLPALDTYDFISRLYVDKGLFEKYGTYDSGSLEWAAGKVLLHPGEAWFVNANNRWKNFSFDLGFVPYPVSDSFEAAGKEYVSPVSSLSVYNLSSGLSAKKEELAFRVWNELQVWQTEEEFKSEFEMNLKSIFKDTQSIEAYLSIYDKTKLDLMNSLGISPYGYNGWTTKINVGIKNKTSKTAMEEIKSFYEAALNAYLTVN